MRSPRKLAKSYTLDSRLVAYVANSKGARSASERINELLEAAIREEQYRQLEAEAAAFYAEEPREERKATRAFQSAGKPSLSRD